jgi:hypothetical protein
MIQIENRGGEIRFTNFWTSEYARSGLYFVSINTGTVRLLVPTAMEPTLSDMKTAKQIVLTRGIYEGRDSVEIMFDDRSDNPFVIFLEVRQFDRVWPAREDGRRCAFLIYTAKGKVWTENCYLRRIDKLPLMTPWPTA